MHRIIPNFFARSVVAKMVFLVPGSILEMLLCLIDIERINIQDVLRKRLHAEAIQTVINHNLLPLNCY